MKRSLFLAWIALAVVGVYTLTVTADDVPVSLLPNPGFESGAPASATDDTKPDDWKTNVWFAGDQGPKFEWSDVARTGKHSLAISSTGNGSDASWYIEVPVQPMSTYRLSAWIKTKDVKTSNGGRGALINLHNIQTARSKPLTGTNDWTEASITFETGREDAIWINCLMGGWGLASGTVWYDDFTLVNLTTGESFKPTITIDASKTAEPMPVYIYSQFIEHLGRCIYGGIWAEMLEDRKFWYPVGDEKSPWKVIGNSDVTMDKTESFVGEHTPVITVKSIKTPTPKGSISQDGLSLIKGKKYVGYAWVKKEWYANISISIQTPDATLSLCDDVWINPHKYQKIPFEFTANETTNNASIVISARYAGKSINGNGKLYIGTVSLMPADNIDGMRADTLKLLKELNSPLYRWPGGNFVSGYDWRDGIGDRDHRPPRKNPAWTGVEHNDFGIDEFMLFCRWLDTEPYIAVNTGLGGVDSAVDELEYANGAADTPMGKLRAENGHAKPYNVEWWGIGNEMYGGWQLGNIPLEDYTKRHNQFAEAFYEKDPKVKLVAVGEAGPWSEGMMQHCADGMELISEHFYRQGRSGLAGHVFQIPDAIRAKAEAHRNYRKQFDELDGKDIRIAMDEWNYWYGPHVFGELGTRYFQKDALGIAAGLNEFARNTDIIYMANYAQTVNVIGCIKTNKTDAEFATTGLVLKLYREKFLGTPLETKSEWPLDVQAIMREDGKLVISVVNASLKPLELPLTVSGIKLTGNGTKYEIASDDPVVYNEPGVEPKVVITESPLSGVSDSVMVKPCSATLFELDCK